MSGKVKVISDDCLIACHAALVEQTQRTLESRGYAWAKRDAETVNICNVVLGRNSEFLGEIRDALGYDPRGSWRPTIINGEWINPQA